MSLNCAALAHARPTAMSHETSRRDDCVARIFGLKGYMVVDHVNRLPERLPMPDAGLTR